MSEQVSGREPQSFDVRVTPFKASPASRCGVSFAVTVNGDEIARSGTLKIAANAILSCLTHYGVEGIDRHMMHDLVRRAEADGFASETFYGIGA